MALDPVNAIDTFLLLNTGRVERTIELTQILPSPASVLAVPVETARAEVNMASLLTANLFPSRDGLFTVGMVTVKPPRASAMITTSGFASSWGF